MDDDTLCVVWQWGAMLAPGVVLFFVGGVAGHFWYIARARFKMAAVLLHILYEHRGELRLSRQDLDVLSSIQRKLEADLS